MSFLLKHYSSELLKREADPEREIRKVFRAEEFAAGHVEQLAFLSDRSPWQHVMCARQSGKSWGCDGKLFENAQNYPRSVGLLLGIKGTGVRVNNWIPIWQQGVCERYSLSADCHNESQMLTTFPNEARVMFAGTDDLTNVKKYLGNRLHNCVVIIDECQDQPEHVLKYILTVLLPPMCTPTTQIIIAGVIPEMPVGYFLDLAEYDAESKTGGKGPGYAHHSWARAANVHTPEAMKQLQDYLKRHNISIEDLTIQRDWFKRRVWSRTAGAYKYRPELNAYAPPVPEWLAEVYAQFQAEGTGKHKLMFAHPMLEADDGARYGLMAAEPDPGMRYFAFALDPGASSDRASVQGWAWGELSKNVKHILDWTTPRGAGLATSQMFSVMGWAQKIFTGYAGPRGGIVDWRYDAGSSQNTIDNLQNDYGIPVVLAAKKSDLKGQVDRNNDLLEQGRALVMMGSALEQDYQRARWDPEARARKQFRWATNWHPDPSEAARYALQKYLDVHVPPPPPPANDLERHRAEVKAALDEARRAESQAEEDAADYG